MDVIHSIFKIGNRVLDGLLVLLFVLFIADMIWSNFITDDAYREGMQDSGDEKALIYDMRAYFHDRAEYSAMSLKELHAKKILSDDDYALIRTAEHPVDHPFSSSTPATAMVLSFGPPFFGEVLHKGDFTAGPQDGDIVVKNGDFSY